jgi:rifampicin phosphotransferase
MIWGQARSSREVMGVDTHMIAGVRACLTFQFGKLRPGDVLVCPITSPVWSVLFPTIGPLVTDTGGILSHPAIIAREHRVPAVVATGNATVLLHDDQVVTIDGTIGQVQLMG